MSVGGGDECGRGGSEGRGGRRRGRVREGGGGETHIMAELFSFLAYLNFDEAPIPQQEVTPLST